MLPPVFPSTIAFVGLWIAAGVIAGLFFRHTRERQKTRLTAGRFPSELRRATSLIGLFLIIVAASELGRRTGVSDIAKLIAAIAALGSCAAAVIWPAKNR